MNQIVVLDVAERVAVLRINRPDRRNALDNQTIEVFLDRLSEVKRSSAIALVIHGTGDKAFCAGSDLKALASYSVEEAQSHTVLFQALTETIDELPCVTIAAIRGACLGGGLEIALACDYRIASDDSRMGFPEIGFNALPSAGGTVRAPRAIGLARTRELMLFGDPIDASTALQWGLISAVCAPTEVETRALAKAKAIAAKANRETVSLLKSILVGGAGLPARHGHALALLADSVLVRSAAFKEGVSSFGAQRSS